ncbi:MAG TPA: hypothetical protein DCF68_11900 [Cyanothece sp. UBA12306]|nr:hypothetical protein [Cyanothece sp. UBA12306]
MGTIWELDFYSRPILDENKKKLWEVVICESPLTVDRSPDTLFRYSQFCSNQTVNSLWLRQAIQTAIAQAGETPQKIRFFRRQMNNMIIKACEDAGITAAPSRRTYTLHHWLIQRDREFYPTQPGYDAQAAQTASVAYPDLNAIPLPDAVRGDKVDQWAFVNLEADALAEMNQWEIGFGEGFPLSLAGVKPDQTIPGLIIFSQRALPLAAWMSGLELGFLKFEAKPSPRLRLETGTSDSWILVNINAQDSSTLAEAQRFESAKQQGQQVHFLAIQSSTQADSFAGFWLLQEI